MFLFDFYVFVCFFSAEHQEQSTVSKLTWMHDHNFKHVPYSIFSTALQTKTLKTRKTSGNRDLNVFSAHFAMDTDSQSPD